MTEQTKRLDCTPHGEAVVLGEGGLATAVRRHDALIKEIILTEAHIQFLRDALENWLALTVTDRKMLGRYHTRNDILGTLSCEEATLSLLRSVINCVEYKIEGLRRGKDLTRESTCIAEQ